MKLLQVRKLSTNTPDTHVQLNRDHVQETADAAMSHIQPATDRGHFTTLWDSKAVLMSSDETSSTREPAAL